MVGIDQATKCAIQTRCDNDGCDNAASCSSNDLIGPWRSVV